ncbi:MAG: helix-turn-helix domain-containing protein [Oscillospiraceae bacterium]|nr:helix-turn-helix domain-containing protein [Oscillospiraceae bacterium]MBR7085593.1 helix-turn-helix domain-containing protein [Oscillospiraceae bacterium]
MNQETEKKVAELLFQQREEGFERASFDREIAFYESIGTGNMEMMRFFASPLFSEGCGVLSKDAIRNLKYHLVVSAALIARFCIRYGMTPEMAYQMSDLYIMKADEAQTEAEIRKIHQEMLEGYTRRMQRVRNSKVYSKQIVKSIEYISEHLHNRIMLSDMAEYLDISEAYLSRLFKEETGVSFSDYVNQQKVEAAASLLRYSDYTDSEISSLFCFSSQSYFIKVFRKHTGMTPKAYKKQYFMPELEQAV